MGNQAPRVYQDAERRNAPIPSAIACPSPFLSLPDELLLHIAQFLATETVIRVYERLCSRLYRLCCSDVFCAELCASRLWRPPYSVSPRAWPAPIKGTTALAAGTAALWKRPHDALRSSVGIQTWQFGSRWLLVNAPHEHCTALLHRTDPSAVRLYATATELVLCAEDSLVVCDFCQPSPEVWRSGGAAALRDRYAALVRLDSCILHERVESAPAIQTVVQAGRSQPWTPRLQVTWTRARFGASGPMDEVLVVGRLGWGSAWAVESTVSSAMYTVPVWLDWRQAGPLPGLPLRCGTDLGQLVGLHPSNTHVPEDERDTVFTSAPFMRGK